MTDPSNRDCSEILLDLLCHEWVRGRLSPEAESLLVDHFGFCPLCREGLRGFIRSVSGEAPRRAPVLPAMHPN